MKELGPKDAFDNALAIGLHERLSPRDLRILGHCLDSCSIDDPVLAKLGLTLEHFAWLLHYRLLRTLNDSSDNLQIETTPLGREIIAYTRRPHGPSRPLDAAPEVVDNLGPWNL